MLIIALVFIGLFCTICMGAGKYRPSEREFQNATVVSGSFTYDSNGRLYYSSINGQPLYRITGAFGVGVGFSSSLGIPSGATVRVSVVKVNTLFGSQLLGIAIIADNTIHYRQTPEECLASWDAETRSIIYQIGAILLIVYLFLLKVIK